MLIAFFVGSFGGSLVGQLAYRSFRDGIVRRIFPSARAMATTDIIETETDCRRLIAARCSNCDWDGYTVSLDVVCPWCGKFEVLYENEPERY